MSDPEEKIGKIADLEGQIKQMSRHRRIGQVKCY